MAHKQQIEFCKKIKYQFPEHFKNIWVLDAGSYDINGNNRYAFENCIYLGVDIEHGKNVDIVSKVHELNFKDGMFDTIITTEMLEHDVFY
jgi:2-polyprenyl-3-methyl-5-hydroxy-6-metoxy-1,4-benzoquinol methylase